MRCARPLCGAPASARLTYDHPGATAWLDDPGEPGGWALCRRHADALKVPVGWICHDRRQLKVVEPTPPPAPLRHRLAG
jgi:hypothetical protein